MDDRLERKEHAIHRGVEWPTLALIAACYAVWLAAGSLYTSMPVVAVALLALVIVLHSSLQHEAIHAHPTACEGLNEALVVLPLGLLIPYRRYRASHRLHHADSRLTDPYDDPESKYRALHDWQRLPGWLRRVLGWNNTLVGRMAIGPAITAIRFLRGEARVAQRRDAAGRQCRDGWLWHGLGLLTVLSIVRFGFAMPLPAYLAAAYLALSVLAIRSFCEHQWAVEPDHRTVIVERSWLGLLFLNNNYHLVHHKQPGLAWYALPAAYRTRRAEWRAINHGYVYSGYGAVLRDFALRAKEPVAHPAR